VDRLLQQRTAAWTTATLLRVCSADSFHGYHWHGGGEDPNLEAEFLL